MSMALQPRKLLLCNGELAKGDNMKDMTVEELLNIVVKGDKVWTYAVRDGAGKIIGEVKEYREAKAELLRRFESLKCCGNCKHYVKYECPNCKIYNGWPRSTAYCDSWQSDGLTREEREGE